MGTRYVFDGLELVGRPDRYGTVFRAYARLGKYGINGVWVPAWTVFVGQIEEWPDGTWAAFDCHGDELCRGSFEECRDALRRDVAATHDFEGGDGAALRKIWRGRWRRLKR